MSSLNQLLVVPTVLIGCLPRRCPRPSAGGCGTPRPTRRRTEDGAGHSDKQAHSTSKDPGSIMTDRRPNEVPHPHDARTARPASLARATDQLHPLEAGHARCRSPKRLARCWVLNIRPTSDTASSLHDARSHLTFTLNRLHSCTRCSRSFLHTLGNPNHWYRSGATYE